jgi:hypothetical protein
MMEFTDHSGSGVASQTGVRGHTEAGDDAEKAAIAH